MEEEEEEEEDGRASCGNNHTLLQVAASGALRVFAPLQCLLQ